MNQFWIAIADFFLASFKDSTYIVAGHLIMPAIAEGIKYQILLVSAGMIFFTITVKLVPYLLGQGGDPVLFPFSVEMDIGLIVGCCLDVKELQ